MEATETRRDLERAFLALHDQEAAMILRYLGAAVGDRGEAEDLAAETFARAWREWPRFREREGTPARNWLLRIARNLAVDAHRQRGRRPQSRLTESVSTADTSAASVDRLQLASALATLSDRDRHLVSLRASGLAFGEVGSALGVSEAAAKMAWQRAARRLQLVLEK